MTTRLTFHVVLMSSALALTAAGPATVVPQRAIRIVLVGDSTVTDDSGWGLGFRQFLIANAECLNTASNGRSSKSFIDEGRWQAALALKGDYYLIQFGHNDQPGKGPERETDPATTYPQNVARFVDDVRAIGANPILVTSLTRRVFDNSGRKIASTLTPWVDAVKKVAAEKRVPLIDLDASSARLSERLGKEALYEFSPKTASGDYDATHLNAGGSLLFGRLVVDELRRVVPELVPYLRDQPAAAESIAIQRQSDVPVLPAPVAWDQALKQPAGWYTSVEAMGVAGNVLRYQRRTGGWPKNIDMAKALSAEERAALETGKALTDSTIDNGATVTQLRYLARVYAATHDDRLRAAILAGLEYLLGAQYTDGGWPQYFPLRADYSSHITFNDDAMVGVMTLLRDVADAKPPVEFVDAPRRGRAADAVARGIRVMLQTQIRTDGHLTGWCQQYDERSLRPAGARTYEHPSVASQETVSIVRFLMARESPDKDTIAAIEGAVDWLRRVQVRGIRLERRPDPAAPRGFDLIVVDDPAAPPIWARFYEIGTNRPIYSGRDGVIKARLAEIEIERRTGYSWLGPYAAALLADEYPAWASRMKWRTAPSRAAASIIGQTNYEPALARLRHDG